MCPALWPRDFATSYSFFACSFSLTSPLYSVPFIILKLNDCYHGWILKGGGGYGRGGIDPLKIWMIDLHSKITMQIGLGPSS